MSGLISARLLEIAQVSALPIFSRYPFTYLDFHEKSGKIPEGHLSQHLPRPPDTFFSFELH
jgi:hypothetical protein